LSDFAVRFGLALVVVIAACAAIIISRRNYAKSTDSERSIKAFKLEFQRSIDAAQAATIKTIRDNIFSVIKTINSTVKDLSVRLARLEERANETATQIAGTKDLDVRLVSLEQHVDATATYSRNLDVRLGRLEESADKIATHIAGAHNFDVRLGRLEESADESATHIAGAHNFDVRLGRLEERADESAAHIAGAHNLDVRLGRLEESADKIATYIAGAHNLDVRLGRLEEHANETATHIAATQKQSLEENERLAARLAGLEQNLTALSDQLSSIRHTIDEATLREQGINNSIEANHSSVINTQKRVDELFSRLEKSLKDLGTLVGLFVKRLKMVNANSTETALRLGDLESHFRSKVRQLEERHGSILERKDGPSTRNIEDLVEDATSKAADGAVSIEANTDGENAGVSERPITPGEEPSIETRVEKEEEGRSDNSLADQRARA
jgi:chromosome segregation ATPase